MSCEHARKIFPTGLVQPKNGMRSGLDALLLAAFAAQNFGQPKTRGLRNKKRTMALGIEGQGYATIDLGCGAGFALSAFLLLRSDCKVLGLDISQEHLFAAEKNIELLGFTERARVERCDFSTLQTQGYTPSTDLILCNPPYFLQGKGKESQDELNELARRGSQQTLLTFLRAAKTFLVYGGYLYLIFPSTGMIELFLCLDSLHFGVRSLRFVRTGKEKKAQRLLLEARKDVHNEVIVQEELIVHEQDEEGILHPTQEAVSFCPWIR